MFNLDEEKIEFALGNRALVFWQGKKVENVVCFFSDVEIRGKLNRNFFLRLPLWDSKSPFVLIIYTLSLYFGN